MTRRSYADIAAGRKSKQYEQQKQGKTQLPKQYEQEKQQKSVSVQSQKLSKTQLQKQIEKTINKLLKQIDQQQQKKRTPAQISVDQFMKKSKKSK